jgi:hypothetical protein
MLKAALLSSGAGTVPSDGSLDSARVLQGQSAEVRRADRRYRAEARAGDFYFEGRDPPIVQGEKGVRAVILHAREVVVETPADGSLGTLAEYKLPPWDALWVDELDDNGKLKKNYRRTSTRTRLTNTLFLTYSLIGKDGRPDFDELYTMRVTGKAIRAFEKSFTNPLNRRSMRIPDETGTLHKPPMCTAVVQFTTELTDNGRGNDWYIPIARIVAVYGDKDAPSEADVETGLDIFAERERLAEVSYTPLPAPPATFSPDPPAPPPETLIPFAAAPRPAPTPPAGTSGAHFTTGREIDGPRPFAPLPEEVPYGDGGEEDPFADFERA